MYNTTNWIKRGYSDQVSKENANALETNRLSYKNIIKDIEGGN